MTYVVIESMYLLMYVHVQCHFKSINLPETPPVYTHHKTEGSGILVGVVVVLGLDPVRVLQPRLDRVPVRLPC